MTRPCRPGSSTTLERKAPLKTERLNELMWAQVSYSYATPEFRHRAFLMPTWWEPFFRAMSKEDDAARH
jgi:hypothetical protein